MDLFFGKDFFGKVELDDDCFSQNYWDHILMYFQKYSFDKNKFLKNNEDEIGSKKNPQQIRTK